MVINAILPIFLLIAFGYALKLYKLTNDSFWIIAEKLIYYIFFPALLISKLYSIEFGSINLYAITITTIASLFVVSFICLFIQSILKISPSSFASVFQGSIRFNSYIGLAVVNAVFGEQGLAIIIIIASFNIPIVNVLSIIILQTFVHPENKNAKHLNSINLIAQVVKNPLILGCIIGIGINFLGISGPKAIFMTIDILGSIALPFGLMAVGAALILQDITNVYKPILFSSLIKLAIYPLVAYFLANFMELDQLTTSIIVIFSALPTATSSYILAKNLYSDHQLMARIITVETLFSCLTLLIILKVLSPN